VGVEGAELHDVMIARGASEMEKEPNVQTEGGPGNVVILEGSAMTRERSEWGRGPESVGAIALVTVLVSLLWKSQLRRARAAECVARKRRRWTALRQAVAMIKASHAGIELADQAKFRRESARAMQSYGPRFLLNSYRAHAQSEPSGRFRDSNFPPSLESFVPWSEAKQPGSEGAALRERLQHVEWYRAPSIMPPNCSVCANVDPSDVQQGELADCYFLSVLNVLAERPSIVHSLFLTTELTNDSVYALRFCVKGIWRTVVIDDFIPCWPGTSTPVFSQVCFN